MDNLDRIKKSFGVSSGLKLTKVFGLSQGHIINIRKDKVGKASDFWMRLALDALELLPKTKREKLVDKYKKSQIK